jgi:hypothetical protein
MCQLEENTAALWYGIINISKNFIYQIKISIIKPM